MDGFSYVNIFDTKGVEYIVIIIFLVLLIPFWMILNRKKEISSEIRKAIGLLSARIKSSPQGLYYTDQHTWTFMERSGAASLGVDHFLTHVLGDVRVIFLKATGEEVKKQDAIAEITCQDHRVRIYSPVSGKIVKLNTLLEDLPDSIREDPYSKGWLLQVKPSDWKTETQGYYLAEDARHWLTREMERFRDFIALKLRVFSPENEAVVLQDGGEPAENMMKGMPGEIWLEFQKEFLDPK